MFAPYDRLAEFTSLVFCTGCPVIDANLKGTATTGPRISARVPGFKRAIGKLSFRWTQVFPNDTENRYTLDVTKDFQILRGIVHFRYYKRLWSALKNNALRMLQEAFNPLIAEYSQRSM